MDLTDEIMGYLEEKGMLDIDEDLKWEIREDISDIVKNVLERANNGIGRGV